MLRFQFSAIMLLVSSASLAEPNYLFQKPALNHTQIVFSFAGDLWSVPREGGDAKRLTTGTGVETDPVFRLTVRKSHSPANTRETSTSM